MTFLPSPKSFQKSSLHPYPLNFKFFWKKQTSQQIHKNSTKQQNPPNQGNKIKHHPNRKPNQNKKATKL